MVYRIHMENPRTFLQMGAGISWVGMRRHIFVFKNLPFKKMKATFWNNLRERGHIPRKSNKYGQPYSLSPKSYGGALGSVLCALFTIPESPFLSLYGVTELGSHVRLHCPGENEKVSLINFSETYLFLLKCGSLLKLRIIKKTPQAPT